jgi:hypothetical protein
MAIHKRKLINMKNTLILCMVILFTGCAKDDKSFSLKTIKLHDYQRTNLPAQKLHLEVFDDNTSVALANTGPYPSDLTLPATFMVYPSVPMTLYNKTYRIELWGDITGYISSCKVNMEDYKIIFPIDMEVENDSLHISMAGGWK